MSVAIPQWNYVDAESKFSDTINWHWQILGQVVFALKPGSLLAKAIFAQIGNIQF
jgi:hypothetical protein